MMRRAMFLMATIAVLMLISSGSTMAQEKSTSAAEEHWGGTITLPGMELNFTLHLTAEGEAPDAWRGTLDIPVQGVKGAEMADVVRTDSEIAFTFAQVNAVFRATINEDGRTASGTLQQAGMTLPLKLERKTAEQLLAEQPKRPQTPKPPFPYEEREVVYRNEVDGVTIAGTLTIPAGDGPFPAVVMITGSGPQDRNESLMGHQPFWVVADHLSRRGIAVLRSDDRGIGGTTGVTMASTSENFALDVLAGVQFLKTTDRIDPARIGVVGHSEGGIVGPMAAAQSEDIAFVVMLAGTGLPGDEILRLQTRLISKASGLYSESQLDEMEQKHRAVTESVMHGASDEEQLEAIQDLMRAQGAQLEESAMRQAAQQQLLQMKSPWMTYFLKYDPRPVLRRVKCPVLAINGSLDLQVPADENLAEIERALTEAGNGDLTTRKLEGLNHLFQHATNGTPAEYSTIEETFAVEALDLIAEWINERFGVGAGAKDRPTIAQ